MPPQPMSAMPGRSLGLRVVFGASLRGEFAFDEPERQAGGGGDGGATSEEGAAGDLKRLGHADSNCRRCATGQAEVHGTN